MGNICITYCLPLKAVLSTSNNNKKQKHIAMLVTLAICSYGQEAMRMTMTTTVRQDEIVSNSNSCRN